MYAKVAYTKLLQDRGDSDDWNFFLISLIYFLYLDDYIPEQVKSYFYNNVQYPSNKRK